MSLVWKDSLYPWKADGVAERAGMEHYDAWTPLWRLQVPQLHLLCHGQQHRNLAWVQGAEPGVGPSSPALGAAGDTRVSQSQPLLGGGSSSRADRLPLLLSPAGICGQTHSFDIYLLPPSVSLAVLM